MNMRIMEESGHTQHILPTSEGGCSHQGNLGTVLVPHTHTHSNTLTLGNLLCLSRQSPDTTGDRTWLSKDLSQIRIPRKSPFHRTLVRSLSIQTTFNFLYRRSQTAESTDCSVCLGCLIQNPSFKSQPSQAIHR